LVGIGDGATVDAAVLVLTRCRGNSEPFGHFVGYGKQ